MYKILTRQEYHEELTTALRYVEEQSNICGIINADGLPKKDQANIIKKLICSDLFDESKEPGVYYTSICNGGYNNQTPVIPVKMTLEQFNETVLEEIIGELNDTVFGYPILPDTPTNLGSEQNELVSDKHNMMPMHN